MILDSANELVAQHFSIDKINELVQGAREGCENAFEQLIRMHHRDVRLFVLRYLGNASEADEISQEVFIQVFKSISNFKGTGSVKSWILGIARNRVLTYLKKEISWKKKHQSNLFDEISQACFASHEEPTMEQENWEQDLMRLQRCLEKLNPDQFDLVQQFYFKKRTADEIGDQIGKKPGAIRMVLMRIRQSLEKCIRKTRSRGDFQ